MKLSIYNRVRYVGPIDAHEQISPGDVGYIIEDYGDGNYEVEFSNPDGTTKAQAVIPRDSIELAESDN